MSDDKHVLLECKGIMKQFNGIQVLKNVDLEVRSGEVHALMGENGAGKSTIIKIITGVYTRDGGEIYMDGKMVNIQTRQDSREAGISVIYQELSLLPALTVTENIYLGQEIKGKFGLPDWKAMRKATKELIDRYNFNIDPDAIAVAEHVCSEHISAYSRDELYRHPELREIVRDVPADAAVVDRDLSRVRVGRDQWLIRSAPDIYVGRTYDGHVLVIAVILFHLYSFVLL